jgi:hypothetical protein
MTLYEFIALGETEKAILMREGVFIIDRKDGEFNVELYNLGEFFVEIFYNTNENKVTSLKPFKTKRFLEPYLHEVSLSEIEMLL